MVRKLVQLKGFDVCQRPRLQEARGRVDFRSRARVDHDGLPAQDASPSVGEPNLDRLRADEPALAHDELGPARRISLSIDPVQVVDHLALTIAHAGHLDFPRPRGDAELRTPAEIRDDLGAMNYILARETGDGIARPPMYSRSMTATCSPCEASVRAR